ncbi:glycosyltransferase involved in cell wall biosynthesis [Oxalobacteraceae bacterium GrIS 2.11]
MNKIPRKICIVATVPFALKVFMRAHIEMLAQQNEVTLVTRGSASEMQQLLGPNVSFINVNFARKISFGADLLALFALFGIFKKYRFDVVHSLMPKTGLLAMLAAYFSGVPHRIHTFTGQVWLNKAGLGRSILKTFDRLIAFLATGLLTDSASQRAFLIEQKIVQGQRIAVLGHGSVCGVDLDRFKPNSLIRGNIRLELGIPAAATVVLFVGRVNQDKGVLDLAKAFVQISKALPEMHLLLVGPDEGNLNQLLQEVLAPCGPKYHRIGYTDRPEDYMACSDIFCLPSYREGFGSVIIEAAAVGLPAVASRIYGLTDAVCDEVTGILHEVKNVQQISDALVRLATDENLRATMSLAAQERARSLYSQNIITNEMRRYYDGFLFSRSR